MNKKQLSWCISPYPQIGSIEEKLATNDFVISRNLLDYCNILGDSFKQFICLPNLAWIDVGAGEARAQLERLDTSFFSFPRQLVAIAIKKPPYQGLMEIEGRPQSPFRYIEGDILKIDKEVLGVGQFDLITDVYAAKSYSSDLAGCLAADHALLKPGGITCFTCWRLITVTHEKTARSFALENWIVDAFTNKKISGFSLEAWSRNGMDCALILKKNGEPFNMPLLESRRIELNGIPTRNQVYIER